MSIKSWPPLFVCTWSQYWRLLSKTKAGILNIIYGLTLARIVLVVIYNIIYAVALACSVLVVINWQ